MVQYESIVDYVFLIDYPNWMDNTDIEAQVNSDEREETSTKRTTLVRMLKEQEMHGDLLFVRMHDNELGYLKIVYKVEKMVRFLGDFNLWNNYRYMLKTDDDSLVRFDRYRDMLTQEIDLPYLSRVHNTDATSSLLPSVAISTNDQSTLLRELSVYSGQLLKVSPVTRLDPDYYHDTNLRYYTTYASGACYAFSSALGKSLYTASKGGVLKKWNMEDATFGHWVSMFQHTKHKINHVVTGRWSCDPNAMVFHPIKNPQVLDRMVDMIVRNQSGKLPCEQEKSDTFE